MEVNIAEQIDKKKLEAQAISEQIAQALTQINQWTQTKNNLIRESDRNQGAMDLLNNLKGQDDGKTDKPGNTD